VEWKLCRRASYGVTNPPPELEPDLHAFALHLHEALEALERAKRQVGA
jgi:hypothetical protein